MIIKREFTVFENEINWRRQKLLRSLEADDFKRTRFTIDD